MIALVLPLSGMYGGVLQTFPSEAYTVRTAALLGSTNMNMLDVVISRWLP